VIAFIDRASNVFGRLKPEVRKRLERCVDVPTQRNWEDAYSIILNGDTMMTLWQAWIAVDPSAPRSKPVESRWPRTPTQIMLYKAIRFATEGSP
jgi:hypothetical protein